MGSREMEECVNSQIEALFATTVTTLFVNNDINSFHISCYVLSHTHNSHSSHQRHSYASLGLKTRNNIGSSKRTASASGEVRDG